MAWPKGSFPFFIEKMGKLFRTDKEMAEDAIRLAVNKRLRLTKYLLLFPYEVKGGTYRTTLLRKISCWLFIIAFLVLFVPLVIHVEENERYFNVLVFSPVAASFLNLAVYQIWIHFRKAPLDRFLSSLSKCRPYVQVEDRKGALESFLFIVSQLASYFLSVYVFVVYIPETDPKMTALFCFHLCGTFLNVALLEQFHGMLSILCRQLSNTPPTSDVDQDALADAANSLNVAFSPHLLIAITSICYTLLAKTFRIILHSPIVLYDLVALSLQGLIIWRIVSVCQRFKNQMNKFYSQIYYYALNLQDPKLQKRFELHLRMRESFVFTAGGVFEIDCTLIHSIVAACTTYLIVLVQFSTDSQSLEPDSFTTNTADF